MVTFDGPDTHAVGTDPRQVVGVTKWASGNEGMLDVDSDGYGDLVATFDGSGSNEGITVLRNKGGGTAFVRVDNPLSSGVPPPEDSNPWAICAGDFNGDNLADVAVALRTNQGCVVAYRNAGGEGDDWEGFDVVPPRDLCYTERPCDLPSSMAAGDLDDDGDLDLAVGNEGSGNPCPPLTPKCCEDTDECVTKFEVCPSPL